jgi:hypothetical protein
MLKNTLETPEKSWGRSPFYSKSKYGRWGKNSGKIGENSVSPGSAPALPVHSPVSAGPTSDTSQRWIPVKNRCTLGPTLGHPVHRSVSPG